jgi:hypothetical protein
MFNLKLTAKSQKDRKPTINTRDLLNAGLISKLPENGEKIELKLVNSGDIVATQDFYASRDGNTLYAKEGWNDYLFDLPSVGNPVYIKCAGVINGNRSTGPVWKDSQAAPIERPTTLAGIKKLLASFPTKIAAAASIGVSVDTLRRMIDKVASNSSVATKSQKTSKVPQKSAPKATKLTNGTTYGAFELTAKELKTALRSGSTSEAADILGVSTDTIRRAKSFFGI